MRKVRRIFETTQEISFISPEKEFSLYFKAFKESELGAIYNAIPWNDIVKKLKIREYTKGPDLTFGPQGMIALMFLKSYLSCSDEMLINHPTLNLSIQCYTDIRGNPTDNKILTAMRAKIVLDVLTAKGIEKTRLSSSGWGSDRPVADNSTDEGREKNRRVVIVKK